MSQEWIIGAKYEVGPIIGKGGMGTVYKATLLGTGQAVAIKSLDKELQLLSPDMLERFVREGEALRRLNHPNIVKVLDTVEDHDAHYIVMELVTGGSLRDVLAETPQMPVKRVLEIALDLSDALTRAHRLNIIHRDLKPANVLIAEDGTPRLTDFGVARMGDTSMMTQTGAIVGTMAYLSPEACAGDKLDARTDIWAFGVMLYEMLAGVRPFDQDPETSTAALLTAILNKPAPDLLHFRPDAPYALIGLIYWMLEKDREKRVSSIRLVGAQIEALLTGSDEALQAFMEPGTPLPTSRTSAPPTPTDYRMHTPIPGSVNVQHLEITPPALPVNEPSIAEPAPPPQETPVREKKPATISLTVVGAFVGVIVLLLAAAVFLRGGGGDNANIGGALTPEATIEIEACPEGQFLVLIGQYERMGGDERPVQRSIVDDLRQQFSDIPFANICIRAYPGFIDSIESARVIAKNHSAALLVGGTYDGEQVESVFFAGDSSAYAQPLLFDPAQVEKHANVRLVMSDERRQTLARGVLMGLNLMFTYYSNPFAIATNIAVSELIEKPSAEVVGSGPAAGFARFSIYFVSDSVASLDGINAAITLDPNPVNFVARALLYYRLGDRAKAAEDVRSSLLNAPDGWAHPAFMLASDALYAENDYATAIGYFTDIIESSGGDHWLYPATRGTIYYLTGEYELAQADIDRALELEPSTSFPYLTSAALALREGDLQKALEVQDFVRRKFPDPTFAERLLRVTFNETAASSPISTMAAAFGQFNLFQWSAVVEQVDAAVAEGVELAELYFMKGFALCNLDQLEEAEAALTRGIELDPTYTILYLIRADVYRQQGKAGNALQDTLAVGRSEQAAAFAPLISSVSSGEVNCKTVLENGGS